MGQKEETGEGLGTGHGLIDCLLVQQCTCVCMCRYADKPCTLLQHSHTFSGKGYSRARMMQHGV